MNDTKKRQRRYEKKDQTYSRAAESEFLFIFISVLRKIALKNPKIIFKLDRTLVLIRNEEETKERVIYRTIHIACTFEITFKLCV